ncbi:partner of Y14 and mago-like [Babylonia areolata]|uniref:partner of Y14 and mago-like n=1 Tax=Babylonia areolata TaxID=304850 RepID=UPI003FD4C041
MAAPITREGVVRDEKTGELIIPASQRPDGTWRKPRRVRDGYIPQEEVPVFESKGTQWLKSLPTHPIGLAPDDVAKMERAKQAASEPPPPQPQVHTSKAAKKNAKRKEKKKQEKATGDCAAPTTTAQVTKALDQVSLSAKETSDQAGDANGKVALAKKLKGLQKKLKQIEDLERRIQSGELKTPEKDQLEKVARKAAVVEEIEDLQLELDDS